MTNSVKWFIAGAFLLGIGFCIYFISSGDLSARESALLSMVLTILSILATWIVTHIYTQSLYKQALKEVQDSHQSNLRTYALKAAEKVTNLSTQLNRLSAFLEESLENSGSENLRENFLSSQQKIESSIHMISTLKSVNDTGLSDWEGVIGDELDEQREEQAEKEAEFSFLVGRFEALSESQIDTQRYAQDSTEALSKELDSIRKDIRSLAPSLGITPIRLGKPIDKKPQKINVKGICPECGEALEYRQRSNVKSFKTINCKSCSADLSATFDVEKGFILEKFVTSEEQIVCQSCGNQVIFNFGMDPRTSLRIECDSCRSRFLVKRNEGGIAVRTLNIRIATVALTDEILKLVKDNLPPQPWPTGTSKDIAEKLKLPPKTVSDAINKLVQRGDVNLQFYGKIYIPKSDAELETPDNSAKSKNS